MRARSNGRWVLVGAGVTLLIGAAVLVGLVLLHVVAQTIASG